MSLIFVMAWLKQICPFKCDVALEVGQARVSFTVKARIRK